jgi:hypothetical protein
MPDRTTYNEMLAAQGGESLANLVGTLMGVGGNQRKMNYMLQASQRNENDAQAGRANAAGALDTQTHGFRQGLHDSAAGAANVDATANPSLADFVANAAGLSQNFTDASGGLNKFVGGQLIQHNPEMLRQGATLTGLTPGVSDAFSNDELATAQGMDMQKNDDNNARALEVARIQAESSANVARINQSQSSAAPKRYNVNGHLVDENGREVFYAPPTPKAATVSEVSPTEAAALDKLIGNYLPSVTAEDGGDSLPAVIDPLLRNEVLSRASSLYRETGDAQAAVAQAMKELVTTKTPGQNGVDHLFDDDEAVPYEFARNPAPLVPTTPAAAKPAARRLKFNPATGKIE